MLMRVPRELLRDTITIEDYAGAGAHGAIYGDPRDVRASFQTTQKFVSDSHGYTISVTVMAIIRPEDGPVSAESRITSHGTQYRVVQVYPMPRRFHPTQWELMLDRWPNAQRHPGPGSGSGS